MKIKKSQLQSVIKEVISELSPKQKKILKERLLKEGTFNFRKEIDELEDLIITLKQSKKEAETKDPDYVHQNITEFDFSISALREVVSSLRKIHKTNF